MNTATARFINRLEYGFLRESDLAELITLDRLFPVLVRCGAVRFTAGAQYIPDLLRYVDQAGDYVRDVSIPAALCDEARRILAPSITPRRVCCTSGPADFGGAFDGISVSSDADPGL